MESNEAQNPIADKIAVEIRTSGFINISHLMPSVLPNKQPRLPIYEYSDKS